MGAVTDALDALKVKYAAQQSVDESAKTLLAGISAKVKEFAAQIDANNTENAAAKAGLEELGSTIDTDTQSMVDAVKAHTPAEGEPVPPRARR